MEPGLRALALVCSLKPSPATSSSELMAGQVLAELGKHGVSGESVRVVDHDVRPGVQADMGDGDAWPQILEKVKAADILVFATPTWLGHMSSVAQRVLERLDAELSDVDAAGRPAMFGKIAVVAVVGNEDGAHKIVADSYQGLNDIGFTIPAQGGHVLERGGDEPAGVLRPHGDAERRRFDDENSCGERSPSRAAARRPVSGGLSRRLPRALPAPMPGSDASPTAVPDPPEGLSPGARGREAHAHAPHVTSSSFSSLRNRRRRR